MNYWMLDYGKWTPEMIATAHLHDLVPYLGGFALHSILPDR